MLSNVPESLDQDNYILTACDHQKTGNHPFYKYNWGNIKLSVNYAFPKGEMNTQMLTKLHQEVFLGIYLILTIIDYFINQVLILVCFKILPNFHTCAIIMTVTVQDEVKVDRMPACAFVSVVSDSVRSYVP